MTPEQEIRARAIEIKINTSTRLAAACIASGRSFDGKGLFTDGDLEAICEYITTGKKPQEVGRGDAP